MNKAAKKFLILLCTTIISSGMLSVSAFADTYTEEWYLDIPSDEYELVDNEYSPIYSYFPDMDYRVYQSREITENNTSSIWCISNICMNSVDLKLTSGSIEDESSPIYKEYAERIASDVISLNIKDDYVSIHSDDRLDDNGNPTSKLDDIPSLYMEIKELCREYYDAGILESCAFKRYSGSKYKGEIYDCITVYESNAGLETILAAAKSVIPDCEVTENSGSYDITGFDVANIWEYRDAIQELLPEERVIFDGGIIDQYYPIADAIDILAEIQQEDSCDTDNSGEIEITDATAILESYANTAAGVAAASEENPMDVNGDGIVGIDDATFVLTVYAELAAGLR